MYSKNNGSPVHLEEVQQTIISQDPSWLSFLPPPSPGYASLRSWVDWLVRAPTGWGEMDGRSPVPPDNQRQSKGSRKATSPAKAPTCRSGLCSSCKSQCKVPTRSRDYLGRSRLEVTFWFSTCLTQLQHRISAVSRSHRSRLLTPDSITNLDNSSVVT